MTPLRTSDSRRQTEQMFAAMPLSPAVCDGGFSGEKRLLPKQRSKSHKRKTKGSLEKRGRKRKEKNIVTVLTHRIVASKAGELSTDPRVPMEAEIPVYDTVWVALRYTDPEAGIPCSAGIAKLAKKRGAKKLKMTQTALVNRMWSRELKLMVITEVDRLTADLTNRGWGGILQARCFARQLDENTVLLRWLGGGPIDAANKIGVTICHPDLSIEVAGTDLTRIPADAQHIFLFDDVNHYWGVSKLQAAAERKRKSNPPAAVGGSAGKKTKGGES